MTEIQALAAPFRAPSAGDWRRLVEEALGGAPPESLRTVIREGIAVEPLHPQARNARPLFARPGGEAWRIVQRLEHPDPDDANAQARRDLERGVTGLALMVDGAPAAEGFGLPASAEALRQVLDGVAVDSIHLRIEPHPDGLATALRLAGHLEGCGLDVARRDVAFALDPIGIAAARGGFGGEWPDIAAEHVDVAEQLAERGFRRLLFEADGRVYSGAGGDAVAELAAVLAGAAAYLRLVEAYEAPPELQFDLIGVTLTVDCNQLVSIAKLRAARLLWARLQEICGAPRSPLRLHAETARRMMMRADPHTNLLRTTIAAFAAAVGGADSVSLLPFTVALGLPDAFARRLARNTQLLLVEEAQLHRVADPAAGSGAVGALTQELSRRAWSAFQEIEREGGIVESLHAGRMQARIAQQREALVEFYRGGEPQTPRTEPDGAALVGVTCYVDREPPAVKVAQLAPRASTSGPGAAPDFAPLVRLDLESRVSRVPEGAP